MKPMETARRELERMLAEVGTEDTEYWRGCARALRDAIKRLPTDFPEYK